MPSVTIGTCMYTTLLSNGVQQVAACHAPTNFRPYKFHSCSAGAGEIDQGLFDLLQQNIDSARQAGQSDAAAFMEKVLFAAKRYSV